MSSPLPPDGLFRGYPLPPGRSQVVIADVPAYLWFNGCGPTAAGMVLGYWDGIDARFGRLIEGDASTQTQAVNDTISSSENYDDYCLPIDIYPGPIIEDLSEPPPGDEHLDNCIADTMKTSQSVEDNYYGWSWVSDVGDSLEDYVALVDPDRFEVTTRTRGWILFDWHDYRAEIDAGRPVILLVDSDGNGATDHFVTAVGYDSQGGTKYYGCHDTYDKNIHWFEFARFASGQPWGIHSAVSVEIKFTGATWTVPDDHATIQAAIDAAAHGDEIVVRPGIYAENIDFAGKAVTLRSEHGPRVTVIDGGQPSDPDRASVVVFENGEGVDSIVRGFTLMNGTGTLGDLNKNYGGGIYCFQSSPTITGNVIRNNSASQSGGGISCEQSSPRIVFNEIFDNTAADTAGGIRCIIGSAALIEGNRIYRNAAGWGRGGGVHCRDSSATITNNTIFDNYAKSAGGGISCTEYAAPTVTNTIVWNNRNENGADEIDCDSTSAPTVTFCDVRGGYAGTGNIDADPLFAAPASGDFHLAWNSPCWNGGDNSAPNVSTDFEGDPRKWLGRVDMGADEWCYHLYTEGDVIAGAPIDLKVVGYPTAPVVLYVGSGIADPPWSTQHGEFWLNWPTWWHGSIGSVPGDGVLVHTATVPSLWPSGSAQPIQALVGNWGGPWTWLTNLEILVVD